MVNRIMLYPRKNMETGCRARVCYRLPSALRGSALSLLAGCLCLQASSFSIDREVKIQYDLSTVLAGEWSGGALTVFTSNQTPAPVILSFDGNGHQLLPVILTIPEGETIDIHDTARGLDGTLAACGNAYDHTGRGSGFLAIFNPTGDKANIVRLYPYSPSRITIAADGAIWTAGLELTNARDSTPPASGVVRHFDRTGKLIGSLIPRSAFPSHFMVEYGVLRSAPGRVGWYTGPPHGPGSRYYEILDGGTVREYLAIDIQEHEFVTGLALTGDGRTYVTIQDGAAKQRLLSTGGPSQGWTVESPGPLGRFSPLYGADGNRLVFFRFRDAFHALFVDVAK